MDDENRVFAFLARIYPMSATIVTIMRVTGIADDRRVRLAIARLIADGRIMINRNGSWSTLRYRIEKEQSP